MAEEATTGETPETTTGQAPATTPTTQASAPAADDFDRERAMETIRKLREVEKQAKAQAKEYEQAKAKLQEIEDAKLSEAEKLSKRLAELEQGKKDAEVRLTDTLRRARLEVAAAQAGAINPADCFALVDMSAIEVDTTTGKVAGVDEAVDALKRAKPYLFKPTGYQAEPFNPPGGGPVRETDAQKRQRLFGGGGIGMFDTTAAKDHGGGVFINTKGD